MSLLTKEFEKTFFLQSCHDDFQRVANIPKAELPQCPVGPKAAALDQEVGIEFHKPDQN